MLSCKDISRLLSDARDRKLRFADRVRLRMHLAMCKACSRVEGQLAFLGQALSDLVDRSDPNHPDRK